MSESNSSNSSNPLLLLLNEMLSQENNNEPDVAAAGRDENNNNRDPPQQYRGMRRVLDQIHTQIVQLPPHALSQTPMPSHNLVTVLHTLLTVQPHLAQVPSKDDSLPLHFAASLGDVNAASVLFHHYPAAAWIPNEKGKIPLHYAAREGHVDMVRFFMQTVPQTASVASKKQKLALHFAAGEGHVTIVHHLLSAYPRGASLPSSKGKVPLHFASRWGHVQIALDLLYLFPDGVRTLDWEGSLPLHDATREGQYLMSRFLVERFPAALATANLRGDIPLFPAVRSGNIELVAYLIQAWPEGGRHVLQNITEEDCLADWNRGSIELLIRGAVDNFEGCELLNGLEPPNLRLTSALNPVVRGQPTEDGSSPPPMNPVPIPYVSPFFYHQNRKTYIQLREDPTLEHKSMRLVDDNSSSSANNHNNNPMTTTRRACCKSKSRSKSPVLEERDGTLHKRHKSCHFEEEEQDCCLSCSKMPMFLPLHDALRSDASFPVISYILDRQEGESQPRRRNVFQADHLQRSALHHAVKWAKNDENRAALVLERILEPYPQAASKADKDGNLPLLEAIQANANVKLVSALVEAYPPAAINETSQSHQKPLEIACSLDCDLCTIYRLLRVDPSFVETMLQT